MKFLRRAYVVEHHGKRRVGAAWAISKKIEGKWALLHGSKRTYAQLRGKIKLYNLYMFELVVCVCVCVCVPEMQGTLHPEQWIHARCQT